MAEQTSIIRAYQIISIRHVKPPPGAEGSGWHQYVIAQGKNTIQGYRQGSLDAVTKAVEVNVAQLNERYTGKSGRAHLVLPTPKKKIRN